MSVPVVNKYERSSMLFSGESLFSGTFSSHGGIVTSNNAENQTGGPGSIYLRTGSSQDNFVESLTADNTGGQKVLLCSVTVMPKKCCTYFIDVL